MRILLHSLKVRQNGKMQDAEGEGKGVYSCK